MIDGIIGLWRQATLPALPSRHSNNPSFQAKRVREVLKDYFQTDGRVDWQERHCFL
jgi:hypothetical protein